MKASAEEAAVAGHITNVQASFPASLLLNLPKYVI